MFKLNSPTNPVIVKQNIGTIDYIKGEIMLSPIKIISTEVNRGESLIEISANPFSNDVIGKQDLYLQLDTNNVTISTVSDEIESGDDISGSNYVVTSSYANGSLVRGAPILTTEQTNNVSLTGLITGTDTTTEVAAGTNLTTYTVTTGMNGSTSSNTYSY